MLHTKIGRFDLRSPIFPASGTFGYGDELSGVLDYSVIGGFVTKGISYREREGNPTPRISETPCGLINSIGLQNKGVKRFVKEITQIKNHIGINTPIIVNIFGETEKEYIKVIRYIEESGVEIFGYELNLSCPNTKKGGIEFGLDKKSVRKIVGMARRVTERFLSAKFPPYNFILPQLVEVAKGEGADAVVLTNTIPSASFEVKSKNFLRGGLSGPAFKPIALRCVLDVYEKLGDVGIIGCGGISTGWDAFHYLSAGARAVQVGTANFQNPKVCEKIYTELGEILRMLNIKNIEESVGIGISAKFRDVS